MASLLEPGIQELACQAGVYSHSRTHVLHKEPLYILSIMEKLGIGGPVKDLVLCWGHFSFQASLVGGLSNKHLFIVGHCDHSGICL